MGPANAPPLSTRPQRSCSMRGARSRGRLLGVSSAWPDSSARAMAPSRKMPLPAQSSSLMNRNSLSGIDDQTHDRHQHGHDLDNGEVAAELEHCLVVASRIRVAAEQGRENRSERPPARAKPDAEVPPLVPVEDQRVDEQQSGWRPRARQAPCKEPSRSRRGSSMRRPQAPASRLRSRMPTTAASRLTKPVAASSSGRLNRLGGKNTPARPKTR